MRFVIIVFVSFALSIFAAALRLSSGSSPEEVYDYFTGIWFGLIWGAYLLAHLRNWREVLDDER
ncbi:MAG: hypothetical protein AAFW98_18285 [Pseudomonadota bacterium]